ncbi:YgjV family protein [Thioalkalivibrio sp. ALE16]|uniref:YgjV family protein n=1 Tax=Thioalkalivibrio sp. ALE16 TaxID=1158172 RepID=UPI000379435D|nr:YgjV family protein [Thioalkalivibrio sp. ALE16]
MPDLLALAAILSGVTASATQFSILYWARWRITLLRGVAVALTLWAGHFALLGALEVSALLLVAALYNLLVSRAPNRYWAGLTIAAFLALTLYQPTLNAWVVCLGSTLFVLGGLLRSTWAVRSFFLAGHALFFLNAALLVSVTAMLNELLMAGANACAMLRDRASAGGPRSHPECEVVENR